MSLRPRARPKPRFRVSEFAQWITDRLRLHSPQREWLTILGVSKELIERVRVGLDAVEAINRHEEVRLSGSRITIDEWRSIVRELRM